MYPTLRTLLAKNDLDLVIHCILLLAILLACDVSFRQCRNLEVTAYVEDLGTVDALNDHLLRAVSMCVSVEDLLSLSMGLLLALKRYLLVATLILAARAASTATVFNSNRESLVHPVASFSSLVTDLASCLIVRHLLVSSYRAVLSNRLGLNQLLVVPSSVGARSWLAMMLSVVIGH